MLSYAGVGRGEPRAEKGAGASAIGLTLTIKRSPSKERKAWYRENRERALQWAKDNLERQRPLRRRGIAPVLRRVRNTLNIAASMAESRTAKRRCAENSALADHFREEIKAIYFACPDGLRGRSHSSAAWPQRQGRAIASGLHVPWNLQYLRRRKTAAKVQKLPEVVE